MKPVTIIAEIGVNHNNDMDTARQLIDIARDAGADFVKFQAFSADESVSRHAFKADYQKRNEAEQAGESAWEMSRRFELSNEQLRQLCAYCRQQGIAFMSSTFDTGSAKALLALGETVIKLPSGEITNLPLLRFVAQNFRQVIISTGMATLDEIRAAIAVLEQGPLSREDIVVLHCNTDYPTAMEAVNLRAMVQMGRELGVAIGYSDHTLGIEVPVAAVALGATVIEKHFTLDPDMPGPDHKASLSPAELKAMVRAIRNTELALSGSGYKEPSASELKNRDVARKSIVAGMDIRAGERITEAQLAVKRPGSGLNPMLWDAVVGSVACRDFRQDELISLD